MKKLACLLLTALLVGCSQKTTAPAEQEPPLTTLDVESLYQHLDMDMDITGLSLSDLHILSNVFLAQKGYPFEDSYLRGIYGSTTWYDSLMWKFDEMIEEMPEEKYVHDPNKTYRENYYSNVDPEFLKLTDEQQAFVNRVKEREAELLKLNFKPEGEGLVNIQNIINPGLIKETDPQLWNYLGANGFAIAPAKHQQLFHVYEQNDYHEFPAFVTTDLFLQLYHLYFDCMLRELEQEKLMPVLKEFCEEGKKALNKRLLREKEKEDGLFNTLEATEWLITYFSVANALLQEQAPKGDAEALAEYERVMKSVNATSEFLDYTDVPFEYSLFRPRGHYTRNNTLKRYFRTMMWLQTVPFRTDVPFDMLKANILAVEVCDNYENPRLNILYKQLTEPMDYLMGLPDDVSIEQVNQIIADIATCEIDPNELGEKVDEIAEKQTRIRPKFQRTSRNKVRLMPQRYQPDAEVLQEMVDYESKTTKRGVPTGLDVFAAMGVSAAEKILISEIGEPDRWNKYTPTLKRMKERMKSIQWEANAATQWMSALKTISEKPQNAPYFMMTGEWDKKSLNAMLASWTELKHDAILYAKQPMGAECGGAGPPDPIVKGYVEPNVQFWQKAIDLLKNNKALLDRYDLLTQKISDSNERLIETAEFFLTASKKELKGQALSEEEYDQLEYIGAKFENMSLDLIRTGEENLYEWNAVQGPDRRVALVADVYTANADNNPNKSILFEGVGDADEIYVIVEIDGYLYLTRGAVFSYREFQRPTNEQRLNDEEWQRYIDSHPRSGVPEWMEPIIVPLDKAPVDNEGVFYSSGC